MSNTAIGNNRNNVGSIIRSGAPESRILQRGCVAFATGGGGGLDVVYFFSFVRPSKPSLGLGAP